MSNPRAIHPATPVRSKRLLWRWFAAGFVIAFVGLAVVYPMDFYDGRAVYKTVLWRYYLLEIQQYSRSSGSLGLTSGNFAAALTVLAEHLLLSAAAGAFVLGIGWLLRPRRAG
jgi:hypothetical protein